MDRVASVQPAGHDFVVLSDISSLPASFETALTNYVKAGGSVFIAAGSSAARHPQIPIFGDKITDSRYYSREGARFLTVGETDPSYPSVEKANRWAGVKFYFAVRVAGTDARVAARLTDQTPLLLEKKIGELTADQVSAAFRKHVVPKKLAIVQAGDFPDTLKAK